MDASAKPWHDDIWGGCSVRPSPATVVAAGARRYRPPEEEGAAIMAKLSDTSIGHLCNLLGGIAVVAGAAATGGTVVLAAGAAQTLLGAGGLLGSVRSDRRSDAENVLARVRKNVERDYRRWIDAEFGRCSSPATADLEAAIAAFDAVLPRCTLRPDDIIGANLNGSKLADMLLTKAAAMDRTFAPDGTNPAGPRVFRAIVEGTWAVLRVDGSYYGALKSFVDQTLLERTGQISATQDEHGQKLDEIRAAQQASPEVIVNQLIAALDARGETARAREAGIERETIFKLAERLRPDEALSFEQAVIELTNAVEIAIQVAARGLHGANYDALVNIVFERIAEKTRAGDFDGAAREADDGFAEWERSEAERRAASIRSGIAVLEAGIEQDKLRRDPVSAALRVEKIVLLEYSEEPARFAGLSERQDALYVHGRDKGIVIDLLVAAEVARLAYKHAANAGARGSALNDLGNALSTLGERESGTARLKEALAAHRAALIEHARERIPLDWAATQSNLGLVLATIGEREGKVALLEDAVAAHRAALQEWTRERGPLQWAGMQNNLGNALRSMGARESGTTRLKEAVAAYRAALEEYSRERAPSDWAATQNNLGAALQSLGERESGTARLQQAAAAYRAALEVWTRERQPLHWAITQSNLGNVLRSLGARESGTARLEEAIAACQAALEERTRERAPFEWAMTQHNLGLALATLGEREGRVPLLKEAISAYRAALEERTRERAPLDWAGTQKDLAIAYVVLFVRTDDRAHLDAALAAVDGALEEYRKAGADYYADGAERLREEILGHMR